MRPLDQIAAVMRPKHCALRTERAHRHGTMAFCVITAARRAGSTRRRWARLDSGHERGCKTAGVAWQRPAFRPQSADMAERDTAGGDRTGRLTPAQFVAKWQAVDPPERAAKDGIDFPHFRASDFDEDPTPAGGASTSRASKRWTRSAVVPASGQR